jgi:hypothetical protein
VPKLSSSSQNLLCPKFQAVKKFTAYRSKFGSSKIADFCQFILLFFGSHRNSNNQLAITAGLENLGIQKN